MAEKGPQTLAQSGEGAIGFEEVFRQELGEIGERWDAVYGEDHERRLDPSPEPTTRHRLVGLAFSGGGIRSATLNLGIAQSLHHHGVFDHVDYLSTVSGGGYLGASLSTLMRHEQEPFPFALSSGTEESPYLVWLRNHSNYLAQRGLLDFLRAGAVLLRGVLINLLTMLPLLFLFALLLTFAYGGWLNEELWGQGVARGWVEMIQGRLGTELPFLLTPAIALLALAWFLLFPIVTRLFKVIAYKKSLREGGESSVKMRDLYERSFAAALLVIAGFAVVEIIPWLLNYFHAIAAGSLREWMAALSGGASMAAMASAGRLLALLGEARKTLVLWVVGLVGAILPLLLVLYLAEWLIWDSASFQLRWWMLALLPLLLGVGLTFAFVGSLLIMGFKRSRWLLGLVAVLVGTIAGLWLVSELGGPLSLGDRTGPGAAAFFVLGLAVELWLFSWLSVDINLTSVNGFYRDRLAAAYLVGQNTRGDVDIEEDVNLHDLRQKGSRAPYHLVNVALNLQGSKDPGIRQRNSDFFIFSKRFVGSRRTGYCHSEDLEAVFPQMDLATAMGISAAAASPNMGRATVPILVAVLTLMNIRLGYWIPNPGRLVEWARRKRRGVGSVEATLKNRFYWRVRPSNFRKEMLGELNEVDRWVNLSDGGHIENMAVFELLRRRCKYILCGDGEADPKLRFTGLATLVRTARLDLGVEIEIVCENVSLNERGRSFEHWALGRIRYPGETSDESAGYLLYLKSSLTGDEDEVIAEYRARHPSFPHQSTADQFFDEDQFEAYRALGQHIADGLFTAGAGSQAMDFSAFEQWFEQLARIDHRAPAAGP